VCRIVVVIDDRLLAVPRNKTKLSQNTRRTWEINAGEKSLQRSSSRNRSIWSTSKDVSSACPFYEMNDRSPCAKTKRKNVIWFLEYAKGNNFRRTGGEVSWSSRRRPPTRWTSARVSVAPRELVNEEHRGELKSWSHRGATRTNLSSLQRSSRSAYISITSDRMWHRRNKLTDVTIAMLQRGKNFRRKIGKTN